MKFQSIFNALNWKVTLAVLATFLGGCSASFLDKPPLGLETSASFFKTEEQAFQATNAVYNILREWSVSVFSYIGITDIVSDDSDKGSTPTDANFLLEVDDLTFDAGNVSFSTVWDGYYQGINRANLVIENVPLIDMNVANRNRLVAEAKFLRAYFYFNLVRWFGDIPLVDRPLQSDEYYSKQRSSANEIYAFIEQDLKDAAAVLPVQYGSADIGRATKGAAQGMLAKMYMTRGRWSEAALYADSVIKSGKYALYPNYAKLFTREGENSSESLFEIQTAAYTTEGGGSQYNEVQGVRGEPNLGWGFNRPSDNLVSSYEAGDPRRDATILYVGETLPDGSGVVLDNPQIFNERYNQKAWVPQVVGISNGNGQGNIRVLRYAEILLIYAEAQNELGQPQLALDAVNLVRKRARGNIPNLLRDLTVTDQTLLRERIWRERRSELALEQGRWFDLIRQGRAASVMQALGKNFVVGKHELFPIPQNEVDIAVITQNPGY